jgi:tubulin-folding cofactor B|mmetsp:Transcript_122497/g.192184  ORF Transcript_122497/g.192184 Transcript_122497/m.192184 type:complete len:290 (+) Transcript_122497:31-900(+)|eukprot:CAMPEP_0169103488 /NCGR_PEP_ID=MMETSP1015-20121227/22744_1 /TAXON_ID=342587 /ORGANISM="Karlodinium micrum, Strain CCMP2283" /LENGTH=289 /DNA_ID=CAMNT_0009164693 /DNA_START=88 /DNA_END=957 /DNA_ORIENTATION=-
MVTKEMSKHMPTVHQSPEMVQLRDYVTAGDETRFDGMAVGSLRLDVTHSNLVQRWHDIMFHDDMTVIQVKEKLYRHGGTSCAFQELYLRRAPGDTVFLMDDYKTLKFYGARSGMELHIKDLDPHSISLHGGLEDVSQVEKYVMADEEYDKMKNTVRAIRREKEEAAARAEAARRKEAGENDENAEVNKPHAPYELTPEEIAAAYPLGGRCECDPGARRGTIRHAGPIINTKGLWIGICLDEPQGNNDGSKDGKRYFDCPGDKYGVFAKLENVRVGDYPERDPFASDDEF